MSDPNLWKAAQACIDAHGKDAEAELRRLAQQALDIGDVDGAAALFEVYQAVKYLREVAGLDGKTAH